MPELTKVQTLWTSIGRQAEAAKAENFQLAPGESWPMETGNKGAASNITSHSSPYHDNRVHDHNIDQAAIIGIAVGGAVALLLAATLFCFVCRSNRYRKSRTKSRKVSLPKGEKLVDGPGSPQKQVAAVHSVILVADEEALVHETPTEARVNVPIGPEQLDTSMTIHPAYGQPLDQKMTSVPPGATEKPSIREEVPKEEIRKYRMDKILGHVNF
jgi:hypothetical protein